MKSTGIVRKIDQVGRLTLPKGLREQLEITGDTPIEILVEKDAVVLRKERDVCCFCGTDKELRKAKGEWVCEDCLFDVVNLLNN